MVVLLAIDNAHSTLEGPGLQTRLRWVKPCYMPNRPTPSVKPVYRNGQAMVSVDRWSLLEEWALQLRVTKIHLSASHLHG